MGLQARALGAWRAGQLDCMWNGFDPLTTRVKDGEKRGERGEMMGRE